MRRFDHGGLLLAEYQGKLFEKSVELNCSTGIFVRRFIHSELLKKLDVNNPVMVSLDINEGLDSITEQFGETDYGKEKYSADAMFWMGYMYRYISYTREASTKFVMDLWDYKKMSDLYYSFHTQDPEWCVRSMLEMLNLTENVFDNNYRLKEQIAKSGSY